jgi:hypothetical protein
MLTNLPTIDTEQAENLLRFFIRTGNNTFLFGRRGIGKTQLAIEAIKALGYKVGLVNLSAIERPDLAGYPNIASDEDVITFKSPWFLPPLKDKADLVLLFDECDKSNDDVQAPLLEILGSKTINGKPINAVACVLLGNLLNEGAKSNLLSSALLDRGAKYELTFSAEKWLAWARTHGVHDLVIGFLQHNPGLICGETEYTAMASPSPRSWTLASNAIIEARALKMMDAETVFAIVGGYVGEIVGKQFRIWYEHYRRFEPMALSLVEKGVSPSDWSKWGLTEQIVFVIVAAQTSRLRFIAASKTKPKYAYVERLVSFLDGVEPELQTLAITNSFPLEMVVNPAYRLYQEPSFFAMSQRLSGKGLTT